MYCKSCGANMPEGTKFCTKCGTPMSQKTALGTIVENHMGEPKPAGTAKEAHAETQAAANHDAFGGQSQKPAGTPQPPASGVPNQMLVSEPDASGAQPAHGQKKGGSALSVVTLALAATALVIAIITGFVLPATNTSNGPKAVNAGIAKVTIKAGEQTGKVKILEEKTPYVVMCTATGGDSTFSDVSFRKTSGEIYLFAKKKVDKDTECSIMWVAYEN